MNTLNKHLETVRINLADRSYDILIGENLLGQAGTYGQLPQAAAALIVTNTTVSPLYEDALRQALSGHYKQIHSVKLPDGEAHKDWVTLNLIFDTLLGRACDRKTVLFALGLVSSVIWRALLPPVSCAACPLFKCPQRYWHKSIRRWAAKRPSTTPWART